ncbi:MAG: HAD family hydrolase [Pseudomonadota bacterium]
MSISDIIKTRICHEDFAEPKPDPAPYLRAAEVLNVSIALCLAVEDSLRGLASAKQAGATVIYWPHDTTPNNDCDYQINATQDINWKEFF